MVHARVGDQLPKVFVQVAADTVGDLHHRHVPSHHLARAGQRCGIERADLLLRVREPLLEVIDDLRLVGQRANWPLPPAAEIGRLGVDEFG